MKRTLILYFLFIFVFSFELFSDELLTVPEKTNYQRTSTYQEVIDFIKALKERHPEKMKIEFIGITTEGRKIPMIILSKYGISKPRESRLLNKPPVLIMANIHAGEVEGKESTQMLIREILENNREDLLENQTVLIIPIFNCDGNEKMSSKNRRDNGPELAGERKNGQGYDLNRDFVKVESFEVRALITNVFNCWDPVLFVDMHTTNGSLHQEPVTYAPNIAPEGDQVLTDYMWKKALPEIDKTLLKKYKVESIPYGNFIKRDDPVKGWRNRAIEARFGTSYYGLRNRFSILDENYSQADFRTRIKGALSFIIAILEYTNKHMDEMCKLIREADLRAIKEVKNSEFPIRFKLTKTYDFLIKSYIFKKREILESERERYPKKWYGDYLVEKTDKKKNYYTTLYASFKPYKKVKLSEGYIMLPSEKQVAMHLKLHGINVQVIGESFKGKVRLYKVIKIESLKSPYQGHFLHTNIDYKEVEKEVDVPKGSFFITLSQPLSRLAAYLLEPQSRDGYAAWNFFDRIIVHQWRGYSLYPVYKVLKTPRVQMHNF